MFIHRIKLRAPQPSSTWIHRPELERRLLGEARVVSIVAGPGFGKTTLAARVFSIWQGPSLWYSMDAADSDLAVFAAHLDAALRSQLPEMRPFDAENPATLGSPKEVGQRFAEHLPEIDGSPLLVFDDIHTLIEGSRTIGALKELIERGYTLGARFILDGRAMPVALHRVAAAGHLASLGAADLAFDSKEVERFLQRAVPDDWKREAVAKLAPRAEGWAAGLVLIASRVSPTRRAEAPEAPAAPAAGGDEARQYLFRYLADEVLEGLSPGERLFLLDTSILTRLETAACDALMETNVSADVLESLATRGLFIVWAATDAFVCHSLFREFLLETLRRTKAPEYVADLHRRATAFYRSRGEAVAAMTHLLEAGDVEAAAAVLESEGSGLLRAGMLAAVGDLLGRIGVQRIAGSPSLLALQGWVQREHSEWDAALISLDRAIALARELGSYDVLAEAVRSSAPILASRNEFERLQAMLNEALALGDHLPASSVTRLRMTLAAVHLDNDRFDEALAIYREITPSLVARGDLVAQGLVLHNSAVAKMRQGDIFGALSTYERALKLKEAAGQRVSMLTTLADLTLAKRLLGHMDEALQMVEQLLGAAAEVGAASLIARAYEQRGQLALLRGDYDAALAAFGSAQRSCDPGDVNVLPDIELGLAQCALHAGDVTEAEVILERAATAWRGAGRQQLLAPALLAQAQCAITRGDFAAAADLSDQAAVGASRGRDTLVEATCSLEAAAILAKCAATLSGAESALVDQRAAAAAAAAVALIHQRDYQFLLRTKAALFDRLAADLRRWGIGYGLLPQIHPPPERGTLRLELLGPFRTFVNGRLVPPSAWKRRKAPELLAYLASNRGLPVARDRLVDLFWPESDADAAHDSLRVTITAIRKAVGDVIKYENNAYRFVMPTEGLIDRDVFDAQVERARQAEARGEINEARDAYRASADLYHSDYLEGLQDEGWQWRERERLRADCLECLRWLARDREGAGDFAGQKIALDRLLEIAPFELDAVRMRLSALIQENRHDEARRSYSAWRGRYLQTVGTEAPELWPLDGPKALRATAPRMVPTGSG